MQHRGAQPTPPNSYVCSYRTAPTTTDHSTRNSWQPWSLVGIDGLANLVLACARCNGDKSGALPAVSIVDRVLERDREVLEQIASQIQWPTQHDRVVAAALGICRVQPAGVPTWSGYKQTDRLDISFPLPWT